MGLTEKDKVWIQQQLEKFKTSLLTDLERITERLEPKAALRTVPEHPPVPSTTFCYDQRDRKAWLLVRDPKTGLSWIMSGVSQERKGKGWSSCARFFYSTINRKGDRKVYKHTGHWTEAFSSHLEEIAALEPPRLVDQEKTFREGFDDDIWASFQQQIEDYVSGEKLPKWTAPMALPKDQQA